MSDPKNILYIRIDGCFGGVERHILCLLKHLDRSRYTPHLVPIVEEAELAKKSHELGVSVTLLTMTSRFAVWQARRDLRRIIQENHIDLVHTFGLRSNLVAGPLAKKMGLPWIARLPNLNYTDYKDPIRARLFHWLNNRLLAKTDVTHVISTPLKNYVAGLRSHPKRIELIPNGIELNEPPNEKARQEARHQFGIGDNQIVVGSLGRIEPIKGYDLLLYTLSDLPDNVIALIGGEGHELENLNQKAHVLGLASRFRLLGFVNNVEHFLKACDIYVQPSRSEGVPHALMEGMAMSLPILATAVGGIEDIIRNEKDGILIPPDDLAVLKEKLIEFCQDDRMRREFAHRARERIEKVGSAENMTRLIERLYDNLLNED